MEQSYRNTYGSSQVQQAEPVGYLVAAFLDGKAGRRDFKLADMRQKVGETHNLPRVD